MCKCTCPKANLTSLSQKEDLLAKHQAELTFRKQASSRQTLKGMAINKSASDFAGPPDCCGLDKSER